ncbi:MAG: ATP-dependent helicase [Burkholderiales bacterium]
MSLATPALNRAQQAAVEYGAGRAAPPLLVIAGAGSGKTATLAHRVAHLVRQGADPQRLLLLTFSRRAAAELTRRAGQVLQAALGASASDAPPTLPWAGTFHSVAAQLLREYAPRIGLAPNFTIHDRGDSEDLMALVRQAADIDTSQARFPGAATCVAIYSRSVNAQAPLPAVLADHFPWCAAWEDALRPLFAAYVAAKQSQHVLDFDDLLLYWAGLMAEPTLAAEVSARFDHVLVDEYQDTNRLQGTILKALKPDGRGVTVVGDDAQAIYGFRAATVRNILDFPSQYAPPAEVITLERNYRSTQPILTASNAVIALARERFTKDLVTERTAGARPRLVTVADETMQARFVAEEVLAQRERGVDLKRQAVLFRTSSHSAALELELARRNIPFVKFGGLKFLDAAHVKDVLAMLRWVDNGRARLPGFRTLRLLPGVGPATATRWLDALDAGADALATMAAFKVPPAAEEAWRGLHGLYAAMQARDSAWPAEMDALLAWYEAQLPRRFDDAALRIPDLVQLRRIASTYASRERFLTELTLDPPSATSAEAGVPLQDEDYLTLSTIHSAKGQEWRSVHVLNCVDGCIPSDLATGRAEEIEEERRLLYVAMTRAKDDLALVVPQRFYVRQQGAGGDRHVYAAKSRFLPESVCAHLDAQAWPVAAPVPPRDPQMKKLVVDLAARMRAAW